VLDVLVEDDVLVLVVCDVDVLVEELVEVLLDVELEVLVLDVVVLDVLVLVVWDVDVLVEELVEVEVELVDEVLVEEELDVLVVVVVVVWFGLHWMGSGLTNSGTATASIQSVLNTDTQSTQSTMFCALTMAPLQLDGSKVVTAGQFATNPIAPGVRSSPPPQSLSAPPHALQMDDTFLASAFEMSVVALPSPGSGHGLLWRPLSRASQHFCRAFDRAPRNFAVALPIACWHLFTASFDPNSPCWNEPL
jgi:hypothetical protein